MMIPQSVQEQLRLPFLGKGVRRVGFANGAVSDCPVHFVLLTDEAQPPRQDPIPVEVLVLRRPEKNSVGSFWQGIWRWKDSRNLDPTETEEGELGEDEVILGMEAMRHSKLILDIHFGAKFKLDIIEK
ncbi:MAG: hypothetical protein SFU56_04130 [Capsulimonadales bacterium]|nr:hypothetical protein [Capsulimonadales bacterium]